jgi:two-component system, NtrC family, sensor kinase
VTRRRMRSKLMLGMGLVAASVGLLALGTAYGMYAYYTSVKITDKTVHELTVATDLIAALAKLEQIEQPDSSNYRDQVQMCEFQFGVFRDIHQRTVQSGLGLDSRAIEYESKLMAQLDTQLKALETVSKKAAAPTLDANGQGDSDASKAEVHRAQATARRTAEDLRFALVDAIQTNGRASSSAIRQSIWWAGFLLGWVFALMAAMLYYFRVWTFAQIGEPRARVSRVHGLNFDQPKPQIHSGGPPDPVLSVGRVPEEPEAGEVGC